MPELFCQLENAIFESDPAVKCHMAERLQADWKEEALKINRSSRVLPIDDAGRPGKPVLVDPRQLSRRGTSSELGRIRLLHAFAHIEFNAINIALDAAYRFREMPPEFVTDWLLVASEEARHFQLLEQELRQRGSFYGAEQAHRGLWDMVCKTRGNVLHRMALVPRVMEARGLDVTPGMIEKFEQVDDQAAADILRIIYRDEIGHVRIGNRWYDWLCERQGLEPQQTFRSLVVRYMDGKLRGPFNRVARVEAGFDAEELDVLETGNIDC